MDSLTTLLEMSLATPVIQVFGHKGERALVKSSPKRLLGAGPHKIAVRMLT